MAHPPELKAKVLGDIALGLSIREVARKHGITRITATLWRDQAMASGVLPRVMAQVAAVPSNGAESATDSDDLGVWIAAYVKNVFAAITVQAAILGDAEWLRSQPPEFVLRAHDDLSDRAARMVASARREDPDGLAGAGDTPPQPPRLSAASLGAEPAGGDLPNGVAS